jgi:CubicO group peptidase (beta-lactamase class C family)
MKSRPPQPLLLLQTAIVTACLIGGPSASAQPPTGLPVIAPAQVDAIFADWNRTDSPGCALSVMHDEAVLYEHGYGMADLEHDATIRGDTPFHVASISKQFTAAAIVLLAQKGKLSLDDEIHKYLPELGDLGAPITIRELLHMTSGLRDQWELLQLAGYRYSLDLITDQDVLSLVDRQRSLNFPPGSRYLYSNTGYTLLAQIVARVSGESLREFTTRNIFQPLGMIHTHFRDDHAEIIRGEALGYVSDPAGTFQLSVTNFDTVGATSLYTTVDDLAKWDSNFYRPIVGGPQFAKVMTQTSELTTGAANDYAFALTVGSYRGLPTVEHGGSDAGYRADLIRFPAQRFSVAILCNTPTDPDLLARRVADLYLSAYFREKPPQLFPAPRPFAVSEMTSRRIIGVYESRDLDTLIEIDYENGLLQYLVNGRMRPLSTDGHGAYQFEGSTDRIRFDPSQGNARRMVVTGEGQPPQIWDRVRAQPVGPLHNYTGTYYSPEIASVYEVVVVNGKLHLLRPRHLDDQLVPIGGDLFGDPGLPSRWMGTVKFSRDDKDHVFAMRISVDRSHNLIFQRQSRPGPGGAETLDFTSGRTASGP